MTMLKRAQIRPVPVLSALFVANGLAVALMMERAVSSQGAGTLGLAAGACAVLVTLTGLVALVRLVHDPLGRLETAVRTLSAEVARSEPASGLGLTLAASGDLNASTRALLRVRQVLAERRRKSEEDSSLREDLDAVLARDDLARVAQVEARTEAVANLAEGLRRLGNGELSVLIERPMPDDLDILRVNFNRAATVLAYSLCDDDGSHAVVVGNAGIALSRSTDLAELGARQAGGIVELRRIARTLGHAARTRARDAEELSVLAARIREELGQSGRIIAGAAEAVSTARRTGAGLDRSIAVIGATLRETSLASLNAGIAAVQAGAVPSPEGSAHAAPVWEPGMGNTKERDKGIAGLLQDVRTLAQRSADAAGELAGLSRDNGPQLAGAIEAIERAGREIAAVALYATAIEERMAAIADRGRDEIEAVSAAERLVLDLEGGARENTALVEKTVTAMSGLSRSLGQMELRLGLFRLDDPLASNMGGNGGMGGAGQFLGRPGQGPVNANSGFAGSRSIGSGLAGHGAASDDPVGATGSGPARSANSPSGHGRPNGGRPYLRRVK